MSSAFQLSCQIARRIQDLPERTVIGKLLEAPLRHTPGEKIEMLNPVFGMGRDDCHQFASYLRVHASHKELAMRLPEEIRESVKPLDANTLEAFEVGHCSLRFISQNLVQKLVNAAGTVFEAADPYFFDKDLPFAQRSIEGSAVEALNEPLEELAILLAQHPLVSRVQELMHSQPAKYRSDKIAQGILLLEKEVHAGIDENVLLALQGKVREASFETNSAARLLTAVYVLRRCIETVLQIAYQAYTQDRIPTLNVENIFNVPEWSIDTLGRTISIDVQPIGEELFARPGNFLYVDLPKDVGVEPVSSPVYLTRVNVRFSEETGTECNFGARFLDEWLNPYPGLLR
ncbi:MAG: hypothetical protein KAW14_04250 [Candidatus Aegiribacteria sp.]|nr:hypothetical protein [Candidatus Aegiribacteria sp.]